MFFDYIDEKLSKQLIFKDESKLSINYVPEKLPYRDHAIKRLFQLFKRLLSTGGKISVNVLITGCLGTGKTVVSKRFGLDFEKFCRSKGFSFKYIHINCRERKTISSVLLRILQQLNVYVPSRGLSPDELLLEVKNYVLNNRKYLLIALDEVDFLIKRRGSAFLYNFARLSEEDLTNRSYLSLILISRDDLIEKFIEKPALSTLMLNKIKLERYSKGQLFNILMARAEEALFKNCISEEIIEMIARLAGPYGDARYAIELLWKSGKEAEANGLNEIKPEHVRKAKSSIYQRYTLNDIISLSNQEKLVLLSIVKALKEKEKPYITTGELKQKYRLICEELGVEPRTHPQIWSHLRELNSMGLIETMQSGKGFRGQTTLIGISEVPILPLERILISSLEGGKTQ